jgi:hypothetical protein
MLQGNTSKCRPGTTMECPANMTSLQTFKDFYTEPVLSLQAVSHLRADYATSLYLQTLALTSPTSGCRSVGILGLRTKATEL